MYGILVLVISLTVNLSLAQSTNELFVQARRVQTRKDVTAFLDARINGIKRAPSLAVKRNLAYQLAALCKAMPLNSATEDVRGNCTEGLTPDHIDYSSFTVESCTEYIDSTLYYFNLDPERVGQVKPIKRYSGEDLAFRVLKALGCVVPAEFKIE